MCLMISFWWVRDMKQQMVSTDPVQPMFTGGKAMEAIARQPEATGKIQTAMLIAAALIEGIGFAALFAV